MLSEWTNIFLIDPKFFKCFSFSLKSDAFTLLTHITLRSILHLMLVYLSESLLEHLPVSEEHSAVYKPTTCLARWIDQYSKSVGFESCSKIISNRMKFEEQPAKSHPVPHSKNHRVGYESWIKTFNDLPTS